MEAGLKLNPRKCRFMHTEVEYLGHVINPSGLKTNPKLVAAASHFPVPQVFMKHGSSWDFALTTVVSFLFSLRLHSLFMTLPRRGSNLEE